MVMNKRSRKLKKQRVIIAMLSLLLIFGGIALFVVYNAVFKDNTVHMEEIKEEHLASNSFDTLAHNVKLVNVNVALEKMKRVPDGSKIVALTFDDGPGYGSTQRILDCLAKYDIKATFFCLGSRVEANPEMAKKIVKAGHEIASHSYNHPNLITLSDEDVAFQIDKTNSIIKSVTGKTPTSLRPPYGSFNDRVKAIAKLDIALWNVDSEDWKSKNGDAIYTHVFNTMRNPGIILFHDIYDSSADGVEKIVKRLVDEGYTFVTYSEINQYQGI